MRVFGSTGVRGILAAMVLVVGMVGVAGCGGRVVKEGDRVRVQYKGTLDNGSVFDQSDPAQPLEFIVGSGQLIEGFDRAVIGMKVQETKTVRLSPEQAYGTRDETRVARLARADLPEAYQPEQGMGIRLTDSSGRPVPGTIVKVGADSIQVDLNHPLAGQALTFEITLVEILAPATSSGAPGAPPGG